MLLHFFFFIFLKSASLLKYCEFCSCESERWFCRYKFAASHTFCGSKNKRDFCRCEFAAADLVANLFLSLRKLRVCKSKQVHFVCHCKISPVSKLSENVDQRTITRISRTVAQWLHSTRWFRHATVIWSMGNTRWSPSSLPLGRHATHLYDPASFAYICPLTWRRLSKDRHDHCARASDHRSFILFNVLRY